MLKHFILSSLLLIFFACNKTLQGLEVPKAGNPTYKPAIFLDSARFEKVKLTLNIVDSLYKNMAESNHYPGIAYGIVMDGKLIHTGNYGFTDIENKIPVSSSSLFRIASMSKSFSAMAILQLRDKGKLNLDDMVEKYLPEMRNQNYLASDAAPVTIRHLLTHSAGFPEDNPWGDRQLNDSDSELSELMKNQISWSNVPGITYEYSNLGYALLGKIITKVSGMPYQKYVKDNILIPLGMPQTEYEYSNIDPSKLAHGYRWLNEKYNKEIPLHDNSDGSWGAMGAMISSIDEFASYMSLHLSAWPSSSLLDSGPLKRSSLREMHQPWRFIGNNPEYKYADGRVCPVSTAYAYGLGWMKDCDNKIYIGHSGGLPGFGSQWRIMPDYGIGVVSFANRTYSGLSVINTQVLDFIVKKAGLNPRELPASDILNRRKNELVKMLPDWKDAQRSGIFAENFFADFIIDSLRTQAFGLYKKAGNIKKIYDIKAENQLRGTFIIEGEKMDIMVYFTLSPENPPLIQEFKMSEVFKEK